jgi:hypothetical protein
MTLTITLGDIRRGDVLLDISGQPILEVADVRSAVWPGYLIIIGTPEGPAHPAVPQRRTSGRRTSLVQVERNTPTVPN